MKIPPAFEQQKKPGDKGYLQYLTTVLIRMWGQLAQVVNFGIELYAIRQENGVPVSQSANVRGFLWRGDLTGAVQVINHNLRYTPVGFLVLRITSSTIPYFVSSTETTITVDCNGKASDTILLII